MEKLNKIVVTDILEVITVYSPKGRLGTMKNRDSYGLSFCEEGQITYTHKGEKYISDADHAMILPQGESYTLKGDKNGFFPVINFKCDGFLTDKIVSIPINNPKSYIKDFEQIKSLFLFERNRAKVMSIFYGMIHKLTLGKSAETELLAPAMMFLEKNLALPNLSNEMLASKCNISEVYFRKLFLAKFGITPRQYIIEARISSAKQLLAEGGLKINAVSEKCGFTNPYHFCRAFKEKVGVTPTEYMKQNRFYKI